MAVNRQSRENYKPAVSDYRPPSGQARPPAAEEIRPPAGMLPAFDAASVRRGIIMAEILGLPVSKRRRR
ncbi:MAG: hypothetical protein GXY20_10695 [Clostridiales bacterium]|jgi:hypothetical protein|nr:hypothetical protein [Clostridiales bacterium]